MDPTHQIALTRNREHRLWPRIVDDLPRQCPACRDKEMEPHLLRERNEIADVAAAAALAVVRIARHLVRAARELQAVRCHDEQAVGGHADVHAVKEQIADRNKRALQPTTLDAKERPKAHGSRKEQIDQLISLPLHPREIRQPSNGKHHVEDAEKGQEYRACQQSADRPRQKRLDALKPRHANVPNAKEEHGGEQCHEQEHTDEEPLLWP